ncbi:MAG: hypothetical protein RLZZ519_1739 [Bacteroidota bacterium]
MKLPEAGNWRLFHDHGEGFGIAFRIYPNEVCPRGDFRNAEFQSIVSRIEDDSFCQLKAAVYVFDIHFGFCEGQSLHLRLRVATKVNALEAVRGI